MKCEPPASRSSPAELAVKERDSEVRSGILRKQALRPPSQD